MSFLFNINLKETSWQKLYRLSKMIQLILLLSTKNQIQNEISRLLFKRKTISNSNKILNFQQKKKFREMENGINVSFQSMQPPVWLYNPYIQIGEHNRLNLLYLVYDLVKTFLFESKIMCFKNMFIFFIKTLKVFKVHFNMDRDI